MNVPKILRELVTEAYTRGVSDTFEILLRRLAEARGMGMTLTEFEAIARKVRDELLQETTGPAS
jgi:hypothetical protein